MPLLVYGLFGACDVWTQLGFCKIKSFYKYYKCSVTLEKWNRPYNKDLLVSFQAPSVSTLNVRGSLFWGRPTLRVLLVGMNEQPVLLLWSFSLVISAHDSSLPHNTHVRQRTYAGVGCRDTLWTIWFFKKLSFVMSLHWRSLITRFSQIWL